MTPTEAANELIQVIRNFLLVTSGMTIAPNTTPGALVIHGNRDQVVSALAVYDSVLPEDQDGLVEPPPEVSDAHHRGQAITASLQEADQRERLLKADRDRAKEAREQIERRLDKAREEIERLKEQRDAAETARVELVAKLDKQNSELFRQLRDAERTIDRLSQENEGAVEFVHVDPLITNAQYGDYRELLETAVALSKAVHHWEFTPDIGELFRKQVRVARRLVESGEHEGPRT
jgi:small-conductance mechanosensitive channel